MSERPELPPPGLSYNAWGTQLNEVLTDLQDTADDHETRVDTLTTDLDALEAAAVLKTGAQTIAGNKTFSDDVTVNGALNGNAGAAIYSPGVSGFGGVEVSDAGVVIYGYIPGEYFINSASVAASALGAVNWLNRAAGQTIALPADPPFGFDVRFIFEIGVSGGTTTITAQSGNILIGGILTVDTDSGNTLGWDAPNGSSHRVMTFNGSGQGGLMGTQLHLQSRGDTWHVSGVNLYSGSFATIFS